MKDYEKPSGLANAVELVVEMLDKLVKSTMGKHWKPFANYIGSIMFFIFIANTSGFLGSGRRRPIMGLLCLWH